MSRTSDPQDPRKKLDAAVISPPTTRRKRAIEFQWFVLGAAAVFLAMAIAASTIPYYAFDLRITRAIQQLDIPGFRPLMWFLSWIGFQPQVTVIGATMILSLWLLGLRWEAVVAVFACVGVIVGNLTKLLILRPRPTEDLVEVAKVLTTTSFPSGHVVTAAAVGGYLVFLAFTLLKPSWERTLALVLLAPFVLLMGVSRVEQGQHWFSDAVGGYVFGSLWLALTVRLYRWGKPRYFVRQPVAPERKRPGGGGEANNPA
jgi:undecaprenyl-diphosphatase